MEAIEEKDSSALNEELGDLMLHIVFQCQIAAEETSFAGRLSGEPAAPREISTRRRVFYPTPA